MKRSILILGLIIASSVLLSTATSEIPLEKRVLLDDQLEILIPVGFTEMPKETIRIKYPNDNRPSLVLTDDAERVNVCFSTSETETTPERLAAAFPLLKYGIKERVDGVKMISDGSVTANGKTLHYLEFVTPTADAKIYNLMFFTDLNGNILMCTFNCTKKERKKWKETSRKIMMSLTEIPAGEDP